jgi:hypothetical protein
MIFFYTSGAVGNVPVKVKAIFESCNELQDEVLIICNDTHTEDGHISQEAMALRSSINILNYWRKT